jgi:hypothetical protein
VNGLVYDSEARQVESVLFRGQGWLYCLFGRISFGALIYATSRLQQGHSPRYRESLYIGIDRWSALFKTRLVASLLTLLGFLLLVIPGIVLLVRFALIEPILVMEGDAGVRKTLSRSNRLTQGFRWNILGTGTLLIGWTLLAYYLASLPLRFLPGLDNVWGATLCDCVGEVLALPLWPGMYLLYEEARRKESTPGPLREEPT